MDTTCTSKSKNIDIDIDIHIHIHTSSMAAEAASQNWFSGHSDTPNSSTASSETFHLPLSCFPTDGTAEIQEESNRMDVDARDPPLINGAAALEPQALEKVPILS